MLQEIARTFGAGLYYPRDMLIVALDTTTRPGSCAVARDGAVVCEASGDSSREQASRLPAEIVAILTRAGAAIGDVGAFAVATGPGSFTGLRIGIASMQGLAFAQGKPLIGVSALDALAHIAGRLLPAGDPPGTDAWTLRARVATWVDAWRGEVYAATYREGQLLEPPCVARPIDLLEAMGPGPTLFVGDGASAYRHLIVAARGAEARVADPASPPLAGTIARLAAAVYAEGQRPEPHAIQPIYVRRPDAVLARASRQPSLGAHAE